MIIELHDLRISESPPAITLNTPLIAPASPPLTGASINAISNRDAEFSEILMRRHINGAWKIIKDIAIEEDLKKGISI